MQNRYSWHTFSSSVRGASHVKSGLPNQDYGWPLNPPNPQIPLIAVADGHGSARSFRSNTGSLLAVFTAKNILQDFLANRPQTTLSATKEWAENLLPKELARGWRERVEKHLADNRFTTQELDRLREREGETKTRQVEDNPLIAYGSTILCALFTDEFMLYLQLGDGDILVVSDSKEVSRPIPADERLIANETTSLCLPKAWEDMRVAFQPVVTEPPALVMLSTDGYANSFRNNAGFMQTGSDYLSIIREDGISYVEKHLPEWLWDATQSGSGDDVTVAIGYRCN